nr:hypothetical protein [Tanacetum cinerariifolium]
MVQNVDSLSKFLMYPHFLQLVMDNQVLRLLCLLQWWFHHNHKLKKKHNKLKYLLLLLLHHLFFKIISLPHATPPHDQPSTPHASPPQEQLTTTSESSMSLLTNFNGNMCYTLQKGGCIQTGGKIEAIDANEDITLVDVEKDEEIAQKLHDEEVEKLQLGISKKRMIWNELKSGPYLRGIQEGSDFFKPDKDVEEPKKKRVADETLLQKSFKKRWAAAEVLGSKSTQEIPSNDLEEMSEEDVQNMLEIIPVSEFKVKALQVKYPIRDWEIHTE